MGAVAVHIGNGSQATINQFPGLKCLSSKFVKPTTLGPFIWTDAGSGADYNCHIRSIVGSDYFMVPKGQNMGNYQQVYRFKSSMVKNGDDYFLF